MSDGVLLTVAAVCEGPRGGCCVQSENQLNYRVAAEEADFTQLWRQPLMIRDG